MRITDRANGSSEAVPATSQDFEFSVPVDCVATPTVGGLELLARHQLRRARARIRAGGKASGDLGLLDADARRRPRRGDRSKLDPFGLGCPPTCGSGDEKVFLRQGVFTP